MTKEEERKYRNALALARRAERDYKFWATTDGYGNYVGDIGGQGGSVRGRNIRGLLDNQATTGLIEAATEAKQAAMTPTNQTPILQKDVGFNWFNIKNIQIKVPYYIIFRRV